MNEGQYISYRAKHYQAIFDKERAQKLRKIAKECGVTFNTLAKWPQFYSGFNGEQYRVPRGKEFVEFWHTDGGYDLSGFWAIVCAKESEDD